MPTKHRIYYGPTSDKLWFVHFGLGSCSWHKSKLDLDKLAEYEPNGDHPSIRLHINLVFLATPSKARDLSLVRSLTTEKVFCLNTKIGTSSN